MTQTRQELSPADNGQTPANGLYVGEIRLLPFRHDQLPFGWHFCNGERFLLTSPQGQALSALSEEFRADWGLEEDLCSISLPNFFENDGGYGLFLRAVDSVTRQVGSFEQDAIRNISGIFAAGTDGGILAMTDASPDYSGPFYNGPRRIWRAGMGVNDGIALGFDASRVVPTGPRNIPANLGMTPAIYLGV